MKKMLRNVVLTFFGLVSIFILSNCQIGLGAAVDVQPPTVSLTSPQADALVRDVFIIEGTYEDDLSVSEVLVSLKEVTTEVEHKELKAVVTPASENELTKGTWSCSINPKELGIVDGTYVATVTAMDTYLHTGTATQTFSIDNTAPLIVLTSPSSTTLDNPTSYGQVFSVEGKAADDSDVDSIDAIIYDENGVEVAKKTITNVSTQIQIDVATWGGGEDDFYKLIYGNNQEAGTKKYQLGFVAYDGARKVPAVEGDRGNSTSVFYMNNDFAEIDGFKTSIAYNLLNGTRAATDPYATWKKALDEKKVEKATFSLNPINNPYFDVQSYEPVGTVNEKGETVIDLEVETYAFMNKNKLTVNLYVGRDKKAIKTETIGIYLLPCDRYGKLLPNEQKVTLLAPHKDKDGKEIGANNTSQITTVGSTSYKWTSDSIETQKIEGLNIGKYYLFDVVAYDYNGVGIRNDNKYGIKMVSTSAAPIIQVTEPGATKSVANSSSFVVKGTVKTAADIVNIKAYKNSEESENNIVSGPFVPPAEAKDDAAALAVSEGIVLNKTQTTDALKWYNYSFTVPSIQEESFSILVFATDSNGQSSSKEIVVTNDKKAPEFDKTASITPYVDVVEKDASGNEVTVQKVNGTINITQLISDDTQVEQVWYYVGTDYPANENSWSEYLGTPKTTLKIQNLDTTQYTKDTNGKRNDIKIYLKAKDKAGNYVGNDSSKSLFIPLNIDQSTDAPQIKLSNLKEIEDDVKAVSITTETGEVKLGIPEDKLETAKNKATVFSTKGNLSIIGSIVDDDGIDKVEVYYCQGSQWDENNKKQLINAEVKGSTTYNLNKELRKDDGNAFEQDVYLLKFIVTDSAGHETGYSSKTIDPFLVAVDDGAPTLEIKTESGVFYAGDVSVKGIMDDTSAKLYRYTSADCTQGEQPITVKEDKSWEDTIKIKEGQDSYIYWYKAIDSYNQETIKEFSFKYDPTEPRFSITEIQSTDVNYGIAKDEGEYANYFAEENPTAKVQKFGNLTDYFTVKGTVKDDWKDGSTEENTSGIGSYFYYYVGDLTETNKYNINSDGWKTCAITKREGEDPSWEAPISFKELENGDTVNIYFAAVDNAGNVSVIKDNPSAVLTVKIDIDKPVVKDPALNLDNSTIKVLALDNESDIDTEAITSTRNGDKIELEVSLLDDETISEGEGESQTQKTYKSFLFKITKDNLIVGDNKFIFSVKDKAGNAKETTEITINNKAPEFSNENTGISESAYRVKDCSYVTAPFTTTANVACKGNNKLSKVYYSDTYETTDSNGNKVVNTIVKDISVSVSDGKFTIPAPENNADYKQNYENKTVTRTVTAENIYGQKATWEYKFNADLTAPVVKNGTKIKIDGKEAVNDWFNKTTLPISGTYTENGSGVKQVTYKLTNGSGTVVESNGSIYTTDKGDEEEFVANIGGFTEGNNPNILDFIATDNAGNKSENTQFVNIRIDTTAPKLLATVAPDAAENTTSNIVWYRFVGETEWKKLENSILTNKTKDVELTGAFEDKNEGNLQSGVREIKINVNNNPINAKVYTKSEGENATWSVPSDATTGFEPNDVNNSIQSGCWFATIPATSLSDSDCTAEIKITDNAGNIGNPEKVNFRVDITPPVVTIEMPSANSTLNGLNTFSGKVNDVNDVKSIKLYYAFAETDTAPTTFEKYQPLATNVQADTKTLLEKVVGENNVSLSDVTSWKFEEVDVNKILPSETVKGNLFILPVAYDKAGNNNISGKTELEGETPVSGKATKVIIDLHSDRPIIKFTNLSWKDGTYEKYLNATTLNASIEDDDGIKEVKVAIAEGENVTTRSDWNTQPVTSSSIKIELKDDGPKTIWLYVKDAADGEFETSSTKITVENASQPYLLFDGNETKQDNEKAISITKDTTKPIIGTMAYGFASDGTTATSNAKGSVSADKAEDPTKFNLGTTNLAGGTKRKYVVFEIPVTEDGSGVESVTMSVDGKENPYTLNKDKDKGNYYTDPIDVSSWEGDKDLTFTVKDKAGLEDIKTKRITIDNSGPVSKLTNPTEDTTTGIVTLSGYSTDNGSGVVKTTRYVVFDNDFYSKENTLKSELDLKDLVNTTLSTQKFYNSGTAYNWSFVLDGNPKESSEDKVNAKLPANETEVEKYSSVPHPDDIYTMSVCIYSEDDLGNKSYLFDDFKYNPFGDRPIANITYPMGEAYGTGKVDVTGYPNLCDMITVQGAARDNKSMETGKVWLQIDMNNDGKFDEDDKTALSNTKKYTITEGIDAIKVTDKDNKPIQITIDDSALDTDTLGTEDFWGIETTGTSNWSISINVSNELQTATFDEATKENIPLTGTFIGNNKYKVGIRAVAMDSSGVMGKWSEPSYFLIDVNAPEIGIALFGDRTYSEDMFLSGEQTFKVTVSDIAGIKKVSYSWANSINELALSGVSNGEVEPDEQNEHGATLTPWPEANNTNGRINYDLEIPVTSLDGVGEKFALKVVAYKDSLTNTTENAKYVVNFDNNAPDLRNISLNGVLYDETTNSKIVNSNGYFSLGGTITENNASDSGFEKLAFYYLREGENGNRIYNPMVDSVTNKDAGRINISGLSTEELGNENPKLPIYGKNVTSITITNDANKQSSFTIPTISNSNFVGLVKIGNSWHSVKSVSGSTITLKSYVPDGTYENVFLGYVQVVDNTGAEFRGDDGITGDDGDGMEESIIPDGRTWTCNAKITSHYIPDGPGKLVVFAFDKAGNVVSGEYDASVQNNAPRLTRVMLATDLNGDGSYEYESATIRNDKTELATPNGTEFGEFVYYSTLNSMGEAVNIANITVPEGAEFVVKNNLLVVPEFVGGNYDPTKENLAYTYKIVDELTEATVTTNKNPPLLANSTRLLANTKTVVNNPINNKTETGVSKKFEIEKEVLSGYESLKTDESDGTETREVRYLAATFWDKTEETTQGVNSCYALLKMPIVIDVVDNKKPTANIIPFYWNSKENSSFVYDDDGNPLGHIDIPSGNDNPGVSGEVYIEGYAWDDTMLGEIWITAPDGKQLQVASYADGKWFGLEEPDEFGIWKINRDTANIKNWSWPDNWKSFEILEDFGIRQSGHTVKWRFRINMTSYGLDEDKSVIVKAIDAQNNKMSNFNTGYTINNVTRTPTYIMDFVPYIKSIYSTAVGSATRSRLGKFPVRAGELMTIEGMNFASGASYTVNFYKSSQLVDGKIPKGTVAESSKTGTFVENSDGQITVTAPQYSRWVEVLVNNVSTKNNSNTNGGYNIEAGYVAKDDTLTGDKGLSQANTAGTNFWTDDRYISVWNVDATDNIEMNSKPISGMLKKVGTDLLFRRVDNGNGYEPRNNKGLVENNIIATWSSTDDLNLYDYVVGSNEEQAGRTIGINQGSFIEAPPVVDMCIINHIPWYVTLDNQAIGESANAWGAGLMLGRQGFTYSKKNDGYNADFTQNKYSIEYQGNGVAASGGLDRKKNQFINPRIAGYADENGTTYVYVSYYDSFSRCLKYAAYHEELGVTTSIKKDTPVPTASWTDANGSLKVDIRGNDHLTDSATVVAGKDTTEVLTSFDNEVGQWNDIMIYNKLPVIVYYNKTKGCIEVATTTKSVPGGTADWTIQTIENPVEGIDFGRYLSCVMDATGNIHVAAQDVTHNRLYYLKLASSTYSIVEKQIVDSVSSVGRWTDIELTTDGTPVISYLDTAKLDTFEAVKVAYKEGNSWEAMTDPAKYEGGDQRTSIVGAAKEGTGATDVISKIAVGFNSIVYAVDFLRGEE